MESILHLIPWTLWKIPFQLKCVGGGLEALGLADGVSWFERCEVSEVLQLCVETNDSEANYLINILLSDSPLLTQGLKCCNFPVLVMPSICLMINSLPNGV